MDGSGTDVQAGDFQELVEAFLELLRMVLRVVALIRALAGI